MSTRNLVGKNASNMVFGKGNNFLRSLDGEKEKKTPLAKESFR